MLLRLEEDGRLTIPATLRPGLVENTLFEAVRRGDGVIELRPHGVADADQAWFWSERSGKEASARWTRISPRGRFEVFDDLESFVAHLDTIPLPDPETRLPALDGLVAHTDYVVGDPDTLIHLNWSGGNR